MCGIAGSQGSLSRSELEEMLASMNHRGPDYCEMFSNGRVHLAHVRLSIIDLSEASNQPMWDKFEKFCIVFNGEIYNYQHLKNELQKKGYHFKSSGDSEVLLYLYIEYRQLMLSMIEGIFSFVIYDLENDRLFIVRDNFGVKPLYYSQNESGFYFASEIKSLLRVKSIGRSLNYDTLYRSLIFLWNPGEQTLFKEIKKVKPGHYLIVKEGQILEANQYWDWPAYIPKKRTTSSLADLVYETLEKSVHEQLVSDVPVGVLLSGGLDSSLILGMASNIIKPMPVFTLDDSRFFDQTEGFTSDKFYAEKVALLFSAKKQLINPLPDFQRLFFKMIYHLDELHADPAALNMLSICEIAKRQGIKVLLSGAGGDDLFTGYRRHFAASFEFIWCLAPVRLKKWIALFFKKKSVNNPILRRLKKYFDYADLSANERILSYFYWINPKVVSDIFVDAIQSKMTAEPMKFIIDELEKLNDYNAIEKVLFLDKKYFLVDHNLSYVDKMSMASGVEVRVPFLSKSLCELAASISSNVKQKNLTGKWILKKAAERLLPKSVIYRRKTGFGLPLRKLLKTELAPLVEECLSLDRIKKRDIFKPEKILSMIDKNNSGEEDYSYPIFAILCFEVWCQTFLD